MTMILHGLMEHGELFYLLLVTKETLKCNMISLIPSTCILLWQAELEISSNQLNSSIQVIEHICENKLNSSGLQKLETNLETCAMTVSSAYVE